MALPRRLLDSRYSQWGFHCWTRQKISVQPPRKGFCAGTHAHRENILLADLRSNSSRLVKLSRTADSEVQPASLIEVLLLNGWHIDLKANLPDQGLLFSFVLRFWPQPHKTSHRKGKRALGATVCIALLA